MTVTTQIGSGRPLFSIPDFRTFLASGAITIKETTMADDPFAQWRRALAGEKQPIYESEPWVGYFAVQDRSPGATPAKGNRWPKVPCAIWLDEKGDLVAERAGERVPVDRVWPYAASRPITYETYQFWHANERWPDADAA